MIMSENIIEGEEIKFSSSSSLANIFEKETTMVEYEHTIIKHFLSKYDNNVLLTAKKLNIGKSKIYRLVKTPFFKN